MIQAPKGTYDVLPQDAAGRRALAAHAERILGAAGYQSDRDSGRSSPPSCSSRGVGGATDIVQKEMYSFDDGGGRSLTLRPEGTAPVCRAYIEHGMHKLAVAGEAVVPVVVLPRREPAAGSLPPVLAGRRRGDRLGEP